MWDAWADGRYRFLSCANYFQERVDAVVIETPPYFHPEQAAAAVDAGKHVFIAKPIAVDAPGCLSVAESFAHRAGASFWGLISRHPRNGMS